MSDHSLVLPFLPVRSKGGPYDDEAYAAGFEMGMLDTRLARGGPDEVVATILSANAEQADLLGMRHGYLTVVTPTDVDGWHMAIFTSVPGGRRGTFYEDDEPVADVVAAFEAGEKQLTEPPPTPDDQP